MVRCGELSLKDYIKVRNAVQIYNMVNKDHEPLEELDNHWIYGPTGVGKSMGVRKQYGMSLYDKQMNKWWDGYNGEATVHLEDMSPDHKYMAPYLLRWADHYEFTAETKGSGIKIRPKRIVITSNYTMAEVFADLPDDTRKALVRRFRVTHMVDLRLSSELDE